MKGGGHVLTMGLSLVIGHAIILGFEHHPAPPLQIGALASNKKFRKELWGSACRKYGLPEGTKRDGSKLKSRK